MTLPGPVFMLYAVFHVLSSAVFRLFFGFKVYGRENVPKKGGAILASNHCSYADILLIGCGIYRRLKYVAKAELFQKTFSRILWTRLGGIPLNRGGVNRDSFKKIIEALQAGSLVVIYPEGTRSETGKLGPPKWGIGMLVALSGVPVIPTYIYGSHKVLPAGTKRIHFHPVSVTYGKPMDFTSLTGRIAGKELYQEISRRIMDRIGELKEEYHRKFPETRIP